MRTKFMNKKFLASLALIVLALSVLHAKDSRRQKGRLSEVRLLYVESAKYELQGDAASKIILDGTTFYFEISPRSKKKQGLMLEETRDFLVNGKSYAELTLESTGRKFEPQTTVYDSPDFFSEEPDAKGKFELSGNPKAVVMKVTVFGAPLQYPCKIQVTAKVGWISPSDDLDSAKTEGFTYNLNLASAG